MPPPADKPTPVPKQTLRKTVVLMTALLLSLGVILYAAGYVTFMMGTKSSATFKPIGSVSPKDKL